MGWVDADHLSLVWWNTSLAPPVPKRKSTAADLTFACDEIKAFRTGLNFSLLGLTEVRTGDLTAIMTKLSDSSLELLDTTDASGKLIHDTALIFDRTKLGLVNHRRLIYAYGKQKLKIGVLAKFVTVRTGEELYFVLSHWKSRKTDGQYSEVRGEYGTSLRESIKQLRASNPAAPIILMGDYNDDPSSPSLADHLLATRDRGLVRRYPEYFYNPFWRKMGESHSTDGNPSGLSVCGTLHYPNGNITEWHTFDQMIFSSAFLNGQSVGLDEQYTRIVTSPGLDLKVRARRGLFDHFPIHSMVTLREFQP